MDYSEILEKLSLIREDDSQPDFSLSRALSLPLDFLVSLVRNRREAELLLKVSRSAVSLDRLTNNYEMISLRIQGLQEAWNELWLSKEPYVVPAIPMIGTEMSRINKGRYMLLEKMDTEIRDLQELERQLCHYIDVNYSLVEELQMEGIDRLAVNKLLLVEVEKELAKRITCICNNESMRGFSSMRQFLQDLSRNLPSVCMTSEAPNMNKDPVDSITNGSCSTEKVIPDEFSQPRNNTDVISPSSQSFASKCIAIAIQGENVGPSLKARSVDLSLSQRTPEFQEWAAGLSLSPSKGTPSRDAKPNARNQSSSASEERLPKVSSATQIFNEPSLNVGRKLLMDTRQDLTRHDNSKVDIMNASPMMNVGVSNEDQQGQIDGRQAINSENLLNPVTEQKLFEQVIHEPVEDQIFSQPFQSAKIDLSKKRPFESTHINGGIVGEDMEILVRDPKRLLLQTMSEDDKLICSVKRPFLGTWETSDHNHKPNCEVPSGNGYDQAADLQRTASKSEASLTSCSCDPENIHNAVRTSMFVSNAKSSTEDRCTGCGCLQPQVFKRFNTSLITWTPSCNPEDDFVADTTSGIQGSESPVLATQ